jgi:parallel beta-helix repeat protein
VVNNYIYNWRGAGAIGVDNLTWATRPSSAYIANNLIYHSQYGIGIWGDNWTVTGNEINRLFAYTFESYWDCDYVRAWGIGLTVTNNYFHGTIFSEIVNPSSGLHAHVDCLQTWSYHSGVLQNLVYDRNWCSEYHEMMIQGINSNFTISNSIFANAFVTDSGTLAGGLDIEGTTGVTVINNTFYNGSVGPFCTATSTNCTVRNNIIYNASCGTTCNYAWQLFHASDAEDHNLAYRTTGAIYNVFPGRSSDVFDPTDIRNKDPLFVNTSNLVGADGIPFTDDDGLRLQAGSPARGSGYGGVDMGAYPNVNPPPTAPTNLKIIP